MAWQRLIRFIPRSNASKILIGEPSREIADVGLALYKGQSVSATVYSGDSVLRPGSATSAVEDVARLLSPLGAGEVGTIRCIGLNYRQHAEEVRMDIPSLPTLFLKPETALNDPWPAKVALPRLSQRDGCADYESELAVVIGRDCKNVAEPDVAPYLLGYTASNDVSSRTSQMSTSQWCFSKGFDGACPIGPTLVSAELVPDPTMLRIRGLLNGKVVQDCGIDDLIFSIPRLVSYLSQSTTLKAGTVIVTGTPAGVGFTQQPKLSLKHGDEFAVEILPHIGTLINEFENEP